LRLAIDPGPPLTVSDAQVELTGAGSGLPELQEWQSDWPLTTGRVVDQTIWETQKQRALDLAEMHGYLGARFTEQTIAIDLDNNVAALRLVLDSGEQAVMGTVSYEQDVSRKARPMMPGC
jgi:translocation and assembly module TamA